MPVVNSLDDLGGSGTPITEEQLHKILNSITLKMMNIDHADGYLGAIDYEEYGEGGHRVYFSNSLKGLLDQHRYFSELLASPELRGDIGMVLTQNIPPDMVTGDNDTSRLQ